ncbi:MAG: aminopeptidase P family protein [Clostridia bacterium]|nr:aminopeptidase P family protein [Clostridia bacterium]
MNEFALRLLEKMPENAAYAVFRPENRRYLTGITSSNGMVLICKEKQAFYTDFRYITMARNDIRTGYEVVLLEKSFAKTLAQDLPSSVDKLYFEDGFLTYAEYRVLADELSSRMELIGDEKILSDLRICKSDEEIEKIKKAQSFTDHAFTHVCEFISANWKKGDLTEKRIAAEIDYAMKCAGAANPSFDTIVAAGENGAKPHAVPSDRVIRDGDMITMDFGSVYDGYCSDMTRTVAVGSISDHQKEIYDIVLQAQLNALQNLRAGMTGKEIDALARDYIAEKGYGEAFGHSLGHGVGLMIHEAPNFSSRFEGVIPAGSVMSVEPGIYLADDCGVRIEDFVVVTEDGCINLTHSPKELILL